MQIKGFKNPQQIADVLEKCLEWNFDIFKLEILTENRYLIFDRVRSFLKYITERDVNHVSSVYRLND